MPVDNFKREIKKCKNIDSKMKLIGSYFAAFKVHDSFKDIESEHTFCPSDYPYRAPNKFSYVSDLVCDKMFKGSTHFIYKRFKDDPNKMVITLLFGESFGACLKFEKKRIDLIFDVNTLNWEKNNEN